MRALGIDLGSKRIGVAVSDRSGTIASPLTVVQRSGNVKLDHQRLAALALEEEAEIVVVGLPLNMNGSLGPAAQAAIAEAKALSTVVTVPVQTFDERRTTVAADAVLMEFKMKAPARRRIIDKVAAAVMLQYWLDARSTVRDPALDALGTTDPTGPTDPAGEG
jgi:putative Holliday junction resolvase